LKRGWADEEYVTTDKGRQSSDYCYLTAEEHLEEQTAKPKSKKGRETTASNPLPSTQEPFSHSREGVPALNNCCP
ncbi:hypothetical protein, partial [Salinisphaera sp. G21_0]|uniref:hypothetical protein n=1 Tax=Salinisphaera sp. G21_0 TaxID=2821094 RepID=UPI001ADCEBF5